MALDSNEVKWYGYPVSFYINYIELPAVIFAGSLLALYLLAWWLSWSYLSFLAPVSLVAEIVTVALAVNFIALKHGLALKSILVYGSLLGFLSGFIASLLAFLRWWQVWLFFNIIVESLEALFFGLVVSILIYYLNRLPLWQTRK